MKKSGAKNFSRLRREQWGGRSKSDSRRVDQKFSPAFFKRRRVKGNDKAPCGSCHSPRAEPFLRAAALIKSAARRPQDTCSEAGASASKIRDRRRAAGMDFASARFPAFLKKGLGEKLSSAAPRTVGQPKLKRSSFRTSLLSGKYYGKLEENKRMR
ncbi:hypothetical protein NSA36_15040 [Anaerotruncus colihominis]|nr:hypothetical protein [Anaerotruncus colihominis]